MDHSLGLERPAELLDLPNEILGMITGYLTAQRDISSFRLASQQTNAIVKEVVGVHAHLKHDTTSRSQLAFYKRIGLRSVVISDSGRFLTSGRTMCRPNLLRKVTFEGQISPKLVFNCLKQCRNLHSFRLSGKMDHLLEDLSYFHLPHLQSLDIRLIGENSVSNTFISTLNSILIMDHLTCPHLKTFRCELWAGRQTSIQEIQTCLIEFLQRNGSFLKKMLICLRHSDESPAITPTPQELAALIETRRRRHVSLQGCELSLTEMDSDESPAITPTPQELAALIETRRRRHVSLQGCELSPTEMDRCMTSLGVRIKLTSFFVSITASHDPWLAFLRGQRSLKILGISDKLGQTGWKPLEIAVKLNKATLRKICVISHFFADFQLNFACFQGCDCLQELLIINRNPNALNSPHILDFKVAEYCPNIEVIATSMISLDRRDLHGLLNLKGLKYLALLNSGNGPDIGVTFDLLKTLLRLRNLEGLAVEGVIAHSAEQFEKVKALISVLKKDDKDNLILNIQAKEPIQRKWTRNGRFVFDIDFD